MQLLINAINNNDHDEVNDEVMMMMKKKKNLMMLTLRLRMESRGEKKKQFGWVGGTFRDQGGGGEGVT